VILTLFSEHFLIRRDLFERLPASVLSLLPSPAPVPQSPPAAPVLQSPGPAPVPQSPSQQEVLKLSPPVKKVRMGSSTGKRVGEIAIDKLKEICTHADLNLEKEVIEFVSVPSRLVTLPYFFVLLFLVVVFCCQYIVCIILFFSLQLGYPTAGGDRERRGLDLLHGSSRKVPLERCARDLAVSSGAWMPRPQRASHQPDVRFQPDR